MKEGKKAKQNKICLNSAMILKLDSAAVTGLPATLGHCLWTSVTNWFMLDILWTSLNIMWELIDGVKMKYVLLSQVNILQQPISPSDIRDSPASLFRRKTEKTNFICMLIIKERWKLWSPLKELRENLVSARSPRSPGRNGEGTWNAWKVTSMNTGTEVLEVEKQRLLPFEVATKL